MNKHMKALLKMDGMVLKRKDMFAVDNLLKTDSPMFNSLFGRSHGMPMGYAAVVYGPPKGGKSVISHLMTGWLHKSDKDAIVLKVDTEYRSDGQLDDTACALYGIDPERLAIMQTNDPATIFDQIETHVAAACESGAKIKLIIIDSLNGIQGRREKTNESVEKMVIGDHAQTVQIGLKRILGTIRKYNIALVLVDQVRVEMDDLEKKRGNKYKMQSSFGVQHIAEYFICVEENRNAAGRKDLAGNEFKDVKAGETSAMKIRFRMRDSTMAGNTKGRDGELTFDFRKGLVNVNEEVFLLAKRRGVLTQPAQGYFEFGGQKWHGEAKTVKALQDKALADAVMAEVIRRDLAGESINTDEEYVDEGQGEAE